MSAESLGNETVAKEPCRDFAVSVFRKGVSLAKAVHSMEGVAAYAYISMLLNYGEVLVSRRNFGRPVELAVGGVNNGVSMQRILTTLNVGCWHPAMCYRLPAANSAAM
jgi:hypothetical protein